MSRLVALAAAGMLAAGCAAPKSKSASRAAGDRAPAAGSADAAPRPPDAEVVEASLRGGRYAAQPGLEPVRFDLDAASLGEEARAALRRNAAWLKARPELEIRVEGHCDDRGTVPYNLALGQRRAAAVRDYYRNLGLPARRMATISFGEEQPLCGEQAEDCWARNRRAETRVRAR